MLDNITKKNIDDCRDVLVGKVPDPKSQIEQITIALIYKFMDDMDKEAVEKFKGKAKFFTGDFTKYGWRKLFNPSLSGKDMLDLYTDALEKLQTNPNIPDFFRNIFKNSYLPYRDPSTLKMFLKHINEFEYSHSEKLGDAYEYLLSVMGSQGDAGQFRSPRHVIDFMVACINPQKNETVADIACGTSGFLLSGYKHILNQNTDKRLGDKLTPDQRKKLAENFVGYDISPDMVRLSLVNMYLHGFATPRIYEYDTLSSDDRWDETFDVILANPPFMTPKGGIIPHKKFGVQANKAEVLFTDYIAEHLNKNGRAAIIVPNGIVATTQTAYKQLRKLLVDNSLIAVVSLPAGCFNPYSGVKTSVLMLDKSLAKKSNHILFIKITNDGYDLGAQRREHDKNDLRLALEAFNEYKESITSGKPFDIGKYNSICVLVDKQKVLENKDIVLSADRYIEQEMSQTEFDLIKINEVCNVIRGITFGKNDQLDSGNEDTIKVATTKACQENGIVENHLYNIPKRFVKDDKKYLRDDDILLSTANSLNLLGRATYVSKLNQRTSFGAFMTLVRVNKEKILPIYLFHCLKTEYAKKYYELNANTTTNISNLTFESLNAFEIPLPPIEIQAQIVKEIEGYQKIVDGAKMVVDNYKPSITINPDWEITTLGEACEINPKKSEVKDLKGSTLVSFVPMADLNENEIAFVPKEKKAISEVIGGYTYFKDNDVLVAKVTPCFENGKAGIAKDLLSGIGFGSSEYFVLRGNKSILPEWIYLNIKSNKFTNDGKKQMSGTSGLQRLPREYVASFQIYLPTIAEQSKIVAQMYVEQEMVNTNKQLITIFEQKIKDKINEVWGVKDEVENINKPVTEMI